MKLNNSLLNGYENTQLIEYNNIDINYPNTYYFDEINNKSIPGVLISNRYVNGRLLQTYSKEDTHVLAIAATRLGKTTQCVIPLIASFSRQQKKKSFIISDPKCELYRLLSDNLITNGYDVLLLNFRDYLHSELWNPLTPIFRKYQEANNLDEIVSIINVNDNIKYEFNSKTYDDEESLNNELNKLKDIMLAEVDTYIEKLTFVILPPDRASDQYWNNAARQYLMAIIYSMLEDSLPENGSIINENIFNFDKIFKISDSLNEDNRCDDNGYFSKRGEDSKAYNYAKSVIFNAGNTRMCIISNFRAKLAPYKNCNIRLITSRNSFEMERLTSDKPTAVFVCYPDETKIYYQLISTFVQNAYSYLINYANNKPNGKLDIPFYFILDEFGNFPEIVDFDVTISACGGRNVWFYLVLQSYAQLNNVYGNNIAEIIKDNLNIHIFLGSNNRSTLNEFSLECGKTTRLSPMSAIRGDREEITNYELETIPLMPISSLSKLNVGECIVTEAKSDVILSKMERYYLCKEFNFKISNENDYRSVIYMDLNNQIDGNDNYYELIKKYLNNKIDNKKITLLDICIDLSLNYSVAKKAIYHLVNNGELIKINNYEYIKTSNEEIKSKRSGKHLSQKRLEERRRELIKRIQQETDENDDELDDDDLPVDPYFISCDDSSSKEENEVSNQFMSILEEKLKLNYTIGKMYKIALTEMTFERNALIRMKLLYLFNQKDDFIKFDEQVYDIDISYDCYKDLFNTLFIKDYIPERINAICKLCGIIKSKTMELKDRIMIKRILFMLISIDSETYDDILDIFVES